MVQDCGSLCISREVHMGGVVRGACSVVCVWCVCMPGVFACVCAYMQHTDKTAPSGRMHRALDIFRAALLVSLFSSHTKDMLGLLAPEQLPDRPSRNEPQTFQIHCPPPSLWEGLQMPWGQLLPLSEPCPSLSGSG